MGLFCRIPDTTAATDDQKINFARKLTGNNIYLHTDYSILGRYYISFNTTFASYIYFEVDK